MRKALLLLAVGLLVVGTAYADKPTPSKTCPYNLPGHYVAARGYFEGFEADFPPFGWTQTTTNPSNTWIPETGSPYEGFVDAYIPWQAGIPQNEWLKFNFPVSCPDECVLKFATMGSTYWTLYADFVVTVNGTPVWSFYNDFPGGDWTYMVISIDLSAYDGQTVEIGFGYTGDDGADQHLDAVGIYAAPEVPENDLCCGAIEIPCGNVNIMGSTECANDDYSPGDYGNPCTGYTASGNDVAYVLTVPAGTVIDLTYSCSYDNSFYLVTDCSDPGATCVVGADDDPGTTDTEHITTTVGAGTYYLIVDSWSGAGSFCLTGSIECPIATQESSWGDVKKKFR